MRIDGPGRSAARAPWRRRSLLLAAALLLVLGTGLARAVSVSPVALFLSRSSRTAAIMLLNEGTAAEDIEITFAYGYTVSDSLGNVRVQMQDSAAAGDPSLVPFLRAFPRRVRLQPGQRQAVRILVDAPASLQAGEYWGRVMVHSRGAQPPIEATQGGVNMRLDLETVFGVGVNYRTGPVSAGVTAKAVHVFRDSSGVNAVLELTPQGNAAFRGAVHLRLVAPNGRVLAEGTEDIAVYRPLRWRTTVAWPLSSPLPSGCVLRYIIDTVRPDLPPGAALPAPTQRGDIPLTGLN